jgi:hypothetical protein
MLRDWPWITLTSGHQKIRRQLAFYASNVRHGILDIRDAYYHIRSMVSCAFAGNLPSAVPNGVSSCCGADL